MPNRKKPATRMQPDELRAKANRAVERFLLSNPAPYGGEHWKERDVSSHGYRMYIAGYKQCQRDQKAATKAQAFLDAFRKAGETNAEAAQRFNEYDPERTARRKKGR